MARGRAAWTSHPGVAIIRIRFGPHGSIRKQSGGLPALLQAIAGPGPLVILPHDNPDPDSLASAATLVYLFRELGKREATIALGGIVGRAENRAMRTYLNIKLVPVGSIAVSTGDERRARRHAARPKQQLVARRRDPQRRHRPSSRLCRISRRLRSWIYGPTTVRPRRSSPSTSKSRACRSRQDRDRALLRHHGRNPGPRPRGDGRRHRGCHFLYPYTNKRRLAKIENARVPQEYFNVFREAIDQAKVYDNVVISVLHDVQYPDMVAEVADFLLRLDEAEWAAAIGFYNKWLHCSIRTTDREINAGDLLQRRSGASRPGGTT